MGNHSLIRKLKWDVRTRLKLIEAGIIVHGEFYAKDLIAIFEISRPQASKDISAYLEHCPDNIHYDRSRKRYLPTKNFRPQFLRENQDAFFELMRISPNPFSPVISLVRALPSVEVLNPIMRRIELSWIRTINTAIRDRSWISFHYQSMSDANPAKQMFAPHTFIHDGMKWHLRGFSEKRNSFCDYILGCLTSKPVLTESPLKNRIDPASDFLWQKRVNIAVKAHEKLKPVQKKIIEAEYNMVQGMLNIPVRVPLVNYLLKLLRISQEYEALKPEERQIVLANEEELKEYIW